jgi:hypothetical protein
MRGLDARIQSNARARTRRALDARHKAGHDEIEGQRKGRKRTK